MDQTEYTGEILTIQNSEAQVVVTNKDLKDQIITVQLDEQRTNSSYSYSEGDKVFLLGLRDPDTNSQAFYITDFDRSTPLIGLLALFVAVVLLISKKWGIYSLLGMAYSFFIIFSFILPQLLAGKNPLLIAILGCLLIAPVTFYMSHGFNRKTSIALISTIIALSVTGILSLIFINVAKLSGFGSDDALFLQVLGAGAINVRGIFLAGIIIGTLGILDDVTISQASIVYQLKKSVKNISDGELYKKAMEVGHDHIASTVNTLVLVYTGAALPLLLLFIGSTKSFGEAVNAEIIADEIVRTLVGSIGLVLAVPITTILAVFIPSSHQEDQHPKACRH